MEDVEALVRDLVAFLEASPNERGNADELKARAKAVLGEGRNAPTDGRTSLSRSLANALASRSSTLLRDLRWIETFDDQFEMRAGTMRLPLDVLAIWFSNAAPDVRAELLGKLDTNAPWPLVAAALADSEATFEDIVTLCSVHAERCEKANTIANGIAQWAERKPRVALGMLERWRQRQLAIRPQVLETLVCALAIADVLDQETSTGVARKLVGSFSQEAREAGLGMACFAWRTGTSVKDRHTSVLRYVRESPRLAVEALRTIARDAWNFPQEALASALAVLGAIDGDVDLTRVASVLSPEIASLLVAALCDETKPCDLRGCDRLLELLVVHPLRTGKLEFALACCHERDPATTRGVLEAILTLRAGEISRAASSFSDFFPTLSMRLGDGPRQAWLLKATQSNDIRLRGAAWSLLANDSCPLTAKVLTDIPADALKRTAIDVAAHATLGAKRIEVLVLLGAAHRTQLANLLPVVREVALEYPGTAQAALAQWKADGTNAAPSESLLATAATEIERALAVRQTAFEEARSIPEVTTIVPTRTEWLRAENQATERAMKEARARSVFASLVSSIPIIRGRTTSFMGGPPTPMEEFSSTVEVSRDDALDPIGAFEKRLAILARLLPEDDSKI